VIGHSPRTTCVAGMRALAPDAGCSSAAAPRMAVSPLWTSRLCRRHRTERQWMSCATLAAMVVLQRQSSSVDAYKIRIRYAVTIHDGCRGCRAASTTPAELIQE